MGVLWCLMKPTKTIYTPRSHAKGEGSRSKLKILWPLKFRWKFWKRLSVSTILKLHILHSLVSVFQSQKVFISTYIIVPSLANVVILIMVAIIDCWVLFFISNPLVWYVKFNTFIIHKYGSYTEVYYRLLYL